MGEVGNQKKEQNIGFVKFCVVFATIAASILIAIAIIMVIIDPLFHYHAPLSSISYRFYTERYMNDGLARNLEYDAIITGTSMNQNFNPSEWDTMNGSKTIKLTYSGGNYKEIADGLRRALDRNSSVTTVIWGIDYNGLIRDADYTKYEGLPEYLFDDNVFNDVSYLFNKEIMIHATIVDVMNTLQGIDGTTMDEYAKWDFGDCDTLAQDMLGPYVAPKSEQPALSDFERDQVANNIDVNFVSLSNDYPQVRFIFFYTPYSILYWEDLLGEGEFNKQHDATIIATQKMLDTPNIELYDFFECDDVTCDLKNYMDHGHYLASTNTWILQQIQASEHRLTKDNYIDKIDRYYSYYEHYDYESLYRTE